MKIIGLDDKEYSWNLSSASKSDASRSKLHIRARDLLKDIFPYDVIHEEVTLPGSKSKIRKTLLYADFFLPARKLIIEVNGQQHSEHVKFFHDTKHDFYKAKLRDRDKQNWCELNNIALIQLEYNEIDNWKEQIECR